MADRRHGGYGRHGDRQDGHKKPAAPNPNSYQPDVSLSSQPSAGHGSNASGYTDDGRVGRVRSRRENTGGHEYPNKLAAPHQAPAYGYASEMHRYSHYQTIPPSYVHNMSHYQVPYGQETSQLQPQHNSSPVTHPAVPMAQHYPYPHGYYHQQHIHTSQQAQQGASTSTATLPDPLVAPQHRASSYDLHSTQPAKSTSSTSSTPPNPSSNHHGSSHNTSSRTTQTAQTSSSSTSLDSSHHSSFRSETSKTASHMTSLPHEASTGPLNKAPGAVLFSFDKTTRAPTKSALGPLGSASRLAPHPTAPQASLPPQPGPSTLHKPGGNISFAKPIVTPIKPPPPSVPPPSDSSPYDTSSVVPAIPLPTPPLHPRKDAKPSITSSSTPSLANGRSLTSTHTTPPSSSNTTPREGLTTQTAHKPAGPPTYGTRTLDSFKILSEISEGAYGIVYKAIDNETGETVAMKKVKIDPAKEKDVGFPVSAVREIRALGLLQHDHVVRLRDIIPDETGSTLFLVLDYVEHDLNQILKKHRYESRPTTPLQAPTSSSGGPQSNPSSEEQIPHLFTMAHVKSLVHQLLTSIAFIHTKSFMHRDIKTSNLLLSTTGKLYLADFGLTKQWKPSEQRTPKVVTISYRAPELVFQAPDYSLSVDMWSVGLVMAELLTGREFLRGIKTELDLISRMCEIFGSPNEHNYGKGYHDLYIATAKSAITIKPQPENKLKSFFPNLSRQGFDLLSRMLCYDPDNRITAAQALVHPWFKEYPEPMRPQLTSDGKVIEPTPKPSTAPIKSDHQPAPSSKQSSAQRPHEPFTGGGGHLQGPVGPNYGPPTGYPAHRRWEDDYPPYNRGGYRSRSPEPYYRDYPPHQGYPPPRRRSPPRRYGDGPPYSHRSDHRYTPRVDER